HHQVKSGGCTNAARYNKENGTNLMCFYIKTLTQIRIYRGKIHSVIEWQQHTRHNKIPYKEAHHEHIVFKGPVRVGTTRHFSYGAGHGYKGYPTQSGTYHTKCHQHPVALTVNNKKRIVVRIS